MDLLLRFIKQGAGKEPCQRDSKGTEIRAVQHTQLRYCEREYLSTKQKSILHMENGGQYAKSDVTPLDLKLLYPL